MVMRSFMNSKWLWSTNLIHGDIVDEERHDPPNPKLLVEVEMETLVMLWKLVVEVEMKEEFGGG